MRKKEGTCTDKQLGQLKKLWMPKSSVSTNILKYNSAAWGGQIETGDKMLQFCDCCTWDVFWIFLSQQSICLFSISCICLFVYLFIVLRGEKKLCSPQQPSRGAFALEKPQ